jgi:hypothetical protein
MRRLFYRSMAIILSPALVVLGDLVIIAYSDLIFGLYGRKFLKLAFTSVPCMLFFFLGLYVFRACWAESNRRFDRNPFRDPRIRSRERWRRLSDYSLNRSMRSTNSSAFDNYLKLYYRSYKEFMRRINNV